MKKHYNTLSFSAISVEAGGQLLFQSGELGARIYIEPSVEAWIDNSPYFDAYIDPNNQDTPIEF